MILEELKRRRLYFDGATGTALIDQGLDPTKGCEGYNLSHPETITSLHLAYLQAGADIIKTNTFGVNPIKYEEPGRYIEAAMACAKAAVRQAGRGFIAFDMGPTGKMLAPFGDLPFEEAVAAFAENARLAERFGADLVLIETMNDSYETKAALLAVKENCRLPVFVTNAYDESGKLLTGTDPVAMIALLEGLGADAIGMNCSFGPDKMLPVAEKFAKYASVPWIVNPNAGLPTVRSGKTVYDTDPHAFSNTMVQLARLGAGILGGCCGTTPEYIRKTKEKTADLPFTAASEKAYTLVSSYTHAVVFDGDPVLIGERINPTGKPKIKEALRQGDFSIILKEGLRQGQAGAQMLDCNAGLPEIDEPAVLCQLVSELQRVCDLPLQVDTTDPVAAERCARIYNGKPLINSVNGSEQSMAAILPIVKKYGAAVIALTMDEKGIPETAEERCAIAEKIVKRAAMYGIDQKNIIADPLALTISSDAKSATVTLQSLELIRQRLGIQTSLGVSNISFGLPARDQINAAFFTMALERGLGAAIMNPFSDEMMNSYRAYRALKGWDANCSGWIAAAAEPVQKPSADSSQTDMQLTLSQAILQGMTELAAQRAEQMIADEHAEPMAVINDHVIPALSEMGKAFEEKRAFLPQLLMSAEAASCAFEVVKRAMPAASDRSKRIVLATVKGDIHDIGKNIVKALLENFGFYVDDLGRDVPPERVVEAARGCRLVGLSALMTTTVPAMEQTIQLLRKEVPGVKVMVGGAVLTQEYADMIGADFYAADAMGSVRIAQSVFQDQ